MTPWLPPVSPRGQHVRLEPLSSAHAEGAREALQEGDIWKHWYNSIPSADAIEAEIERPLGLQSQGSMRNTSVYSIIASEWPAVKTHLDHQLQRTR